MQELKGGVVERTRGYPGEELEGFGRNARTARLREKEWKNSMKLGSQNRWNKGCRSGNEGVV